MTKKERERLKVVEQIKPGKLTYSEGSDRLDLEMSADSGGLAGYDF